MFSSTTKQTMVKHNSVFVNKFVNMRLDIYIYIYKQA